MTARGKDSVPADVPEVIANRYAVERVLGRGGMATVYLCTDESSGNRVAVKVLRPDLSSAVVIERFLREIDFASHLAHPRIPAVLDSGVVKDLPYYVMTFIEGESLRARIDREKQLQIVEAVRIARDVAELMTYAHERGIVHRDIKPENILLARDDVYVLDFGIARAIIASADEKLTSTGIAVGTPAYMSPEQAMSETVDARSDVYSLGCVTYEMVAGIPPFVGATAQVVMSRRFIAPPPPLRETRDGVPEVVQRAVATAMARAPADRWQTAAEFAAALVARPLSESVQEVRRVVDRRRLLAARGLAATIGVAVLAGGGWAWSASRRDDSVAARKLIGRWEIAAAESLLERRVARRPADVEAQLWLAQAKMLRGAKADEWKPALLAATEGSESFDPTEQKRADALAAFVAGKYALACREFEKLRALARAADRADFTATLALGDCLVENKLVVTDPSTPSGLSFAASYQFADSIYGALLERNMSNPAAFSAIMPRLERVLAVDKRVLRRGTLAGGEVVVAQVALVGDTIAYTPYRLSGTSAPATFGTTISLDAAITRNVERLRRFAGAWTRAAPTDPASHETLARLLENSGALEGELSALGELVIARRLSIAGPSESADAQIARMRLASSLARVLVRLGRFREAAAIADSALAFRLSADLDEESRHRAEGFQWHLAALTGRVHRVVATMRRYASTYRIRLPAGLETPPLPLAVDAIGLTNYAAFGGPRDSIFVIAQRIDRGITTLVAPAKQASMRSAILTSALSLAAPVAGLTGLNDIGPSSDPIVRSLRALADGNHRLVRSYLDSLMRLHSERAPGEISMDVTYEKAWILAQVGDTARAVSLLDAALEGISRAPASVLTAPVPTAAMVRAMVLRAEIGRKLNQQDASRKWGQAALQLWGKADSALLADVRRVGAP